MSLVLKIFLLAIGLKIIHSGLIKNAWLTGLSFGVLLPLLGLVDGLHPVMIGTELVLSLALCPPLFAWNSKMDGLVSSVLVAAFTAFVVCVLTPATTFIIFTQYLWPMIN